MVLGFNLSITQAGIATYPPSNPHLLVLGRCMRSTMVNLMLALLLIRISHHFCSVALGDLSGRTIATNATHHGGRTELDMHNLFGHLMARAANLAVRELRPGKRPFLISRSTFAGSGRWTGHWVSRIFLDDRAV
jgi:alpha-glucosidase (family GH31 glycosyl hydrolase)